MKEVEKRQVMDVELIWKHEARIHILDGCEQESQR
jgi:hypothetical protein